MVKFWETVFQDPLQNPLWNIIRLAAIPTLLTKAHSSCFWDLFWILNWLRSTEMTISRCDWVWKTKQKRFYVFNCLNYYHMCRFSSINCTNCDHLQTFSDNTDVCYDFSLLSFNSKQSLLSLFENEIQWSRPMNSNDSNHLSINNTNGTNNFSRLKSVRAKPQSFEGWKDNVINICKSDNVKRLQEGHKLWKIRKKTLVGISWYQRKFQLNLRWNQHFFCFIFNLQKMDFFPFLVICAFIMETTRKSTLAT